MNALFLCLANSYKYGGRCLAGVLLEEHASGYHIVRNPDGSPRWIRPVMPEGTGEIPASIAIGIDLLDIVSIYDVVECPHGAHSEDVSFTQLKKIRSYSNKQKVVELICDNVHTSLLGFTEKKLTPEQYLQGTHSLELISPQKIRIVREEKDNHIKFRVFFTYHKVQYNCSLTDPYYLRLLRLYGIESITRNQGEMYLVISLSKEYMGYHHKLVAGVIDMVPDIFQSTSRIPEELQVKTPKQALKEYFGYDEFRPYQESIIEHIMSEKDCLVLMPTGGGKSICYQIPALLRGGVAVVISPLISLMKDQVEALSANGIAAAALNSTRSRVEIEEIRRQLMDGHIKLLYMSPERILSEIQDLLQHIEISLFAIDEAHCISHWGHDFRPEYALLGQLREFFPDVPIAAFTATADKITRQDILEQLCLRDPRIFISSFNRPNLSLDVRSGLSSDDKFQSILSLVHRHSEESGIIYCTSRRTTEELADKLKSKGVKAAAYHARLSNSIRSDVQDDFQNDRIHVVCATIAFGMGIDKSNVRFVAHYNLPKNIECYYQEIGRGGRDGLPCETILYYNVSDITQLRKFCISSDMEEIMLEKLERMREYAESQICRRQILLNYFNESMDHECGNCDVCQHPPVRFDGTKIVQKALSAIARTKQQISQSVAIQILRGQDTQTVRQNGYHLLRTYGVGRDLSARDWRDYFVQMFQLGYYEVDYKNDNHLMITQQGWNVLNGDKSALLVVNRHEDFSVKGRKKQRTLTDYEDDEHTNENSASKALFEGLRKLRSQIAKEQKKPAYIVFSDRTLIEIAKHQPTSVSDMLNISGVGRRKLLDYGLPFVSEVRKYKCLSIEFDGIWDAFPEY